MQDDPPGMEGYGILGMPIINGASPLMKKRVRRIGAPGRM